MADNPDITAGTASVAAGTKAVTGVGTFWNTDEIRSGDLFASDGYPGARIDTVNSDTSITLRDNWRGSSLAAGSSYYIRYQPDGSRYAALLAAVRKILTQPILTAFAGLTGAADTIAYFSSATTMATVSFKLWARSFLGMTMAADKLPFGTGVNTMGLADFTQAGRDLIGDVDAAAQRTRLGAVAGPGSSVDGNLALFSGTTGKLIKDGGQVTAAGLALLNAIGTPAADRLLYLTGANAAAVATLTPLARNVLATNTVAAMAIAMGYQFSGNFASGYIKRPDGTIRVWGQTTGDTTTAFATAMPGTVLSHGATLQDANTASNEAASIQASAVTGTGITWRPRFIVVGTIGVAIQTYKWWAEGI